MSVFFSNKVRSKYLRLFREGVFSVLRGLNDYELRVVKKQDVRDTVDCIRWTMEDAKDPSKIFILLYCNSLLLFFL